MGANGENVRITQPCHQSVHLLLLKPSVWIAMDELRAGCRELKRCIIQRDPVSDSVEPAIGIYLVPAGVTTYEGIAREACDTTPDLYRQSSNNLGRREVKPPT
jgi:hypothetical protein